MVRSQGSRVLGETFRRSAREFWLISDFLDVRVGGKRTREEATASSLVSIGVPAIMSSHPPLALPHFGETVPANGRASGVRVASVPWQ